MVKNLAWIFSEVLIMLRSVKAQIQGLSESLISSDKLVPGGVGSGQVWSGFGEENHKKYVTMLWIKCRVKVSLS